MQLRYIILATLITFLTLAGYRAINKELEYMELESAFYECLQDLTYQECKAGIL